MTNKGTLHFLRNRLIFLRVQKHYRFLTVQNILQIFNTFPFCKLHFSLLKALFSSNIQILMLTGLSIGGTTCSGKFALGGQDYEFNKHEATNGYWQLEFTMNKNNIDKFFPDRVERGNNYRERDCTGGRRGCDGLVEENIFQRVHSRGGTRRRI